MLMFKFMIDPQVKERPRKAKTGHFYTPQNTREFERDVKFLAKQFYKGHKMLHGPLDIEVVFCVKKPKKPKYSYPKRGDLDNYVKSFLDSLNGIIYEDDSQVVRCLSMKRYSSEACIIMRVTEISDPQLDTDLIT